MKRAWFAAGEVATYDEAGGMMIEHQEPLRFPDAPKTDLDIALTELMSTAQRVVSAQGRLRSLLDASQSVVQLTDLASVLRRIAQVALELVDARYAAIGVLTPDGRLEQFIHVGMSAEDASAIGHLPEGHGILGALIDDPRPIRLDHLGDDPRSSGFPAGHPNMDSFLGVPIRVRDEIFGNIYLTEHKTDGFSDEDQELLTSLAATAGIAIDNARLLEETRRRQRWAAAAAEVTAALVADAAPNALDFIADRVVELAGADLVCIVFRSGADSLAVETSAGPLGDGVRGRVMPASDTLVARAMESGQPVLTDSSTMTDATPHPWIELGQTMAIPLVRSDRQHGVMTVSRSVGAPHFTSADVEMTADFAGHVSIALALAQGRANATRLALLEDRSRIARDLHDHVIQKLFSAGLALQALDIAPDDRATRAGITSTVHTLDDSIAQIRTAIFALVSPDAREHGSLRHGIIDTISEASAALASSPRVVFTGPVDLLVPDEFSADVLAVVRESLANVAKHANADETLVTVTVTEDEISVDVTDDGDGVPDEHRSSGTDNLRRRATELGGHLSLRRRRTGGTHLQWRVPLPRAEENR